MSDKILSESDIACYRDGIDILGVQQICESHEQLRRARDLLAVKYSQDMTDMRRQLAVTKAGEDAWRRGAMEVLDELSVASTPASMSPPIRIRVLTRERDALKAQLARAEEALRKVQDSLGPCFLPSASPAMEAYTAARAYFAEGAARGRKGGEP